MSSSDSAPPKKTWEGSYQEIIAFHKDHGHFNPSMKDPACQKLALWVMRQRQMKKKCTIPPVHVEQLDKIGFTWEPNPGILWLASFLELKVFQQEFGHCNPEWGLENGGGAPAAKYQRVIEWSEAQRVNGEKLSEDQRDRLNSIGFLWKPNQKDRNWEEKVQLWKKYDFDKRFAQASDPPLPLPIMGKVMYHWMRDQRKANKEHTLPEVRKNRLDSLGFEWDKNEKELRWYAKLDRLKLYKAEHGDCNVPGGYKEKALAQWVNNQRTINRRGRLPQDRIDQLNDLGFVWVTKLSHFNPGCSPSADAKTTPDSPQSSSSQEASLSKVKERTEELPSCSSSQKASLSLPLKKRTVDSPSCCSSQSASLKLKLKKRTPDPPSSSTSGKKASLSSKLKKRTSELTSSISGKKVSLSSKLKRRTKKKQEENEAPVPVPSAVTATHGKKRKKSDPPPEPVPSKSEEASNAGPTTLDSAPEQAPSNPDDAGPERISSSLWSSLSTTNVVAAKKRRRSQIVKLEYFKFGENFKRPDAEVPAAPEPAAPEPAAPKDATEGESYSEEASSVDWEESSVESLPRGTPKKSPRLKKRNKRDDEGDETSTTLDMTSSLGQESNETIPAVAKKRKKPKRQSTPKAITADMVSTPKRISVYWPDDDEYYEGLATKKKDHKNQLFVEYDDGESEWLDLHKMTIRILGDAKSGSNNRNDSRKINTQADRLKVGSRVSIWWPAEKEYFDAKVAKIADKHYKKPHFVEYDDGDSEWINLYFRNFKILSSVADLEPGNRISVWWDAENRFYEATVKKILTHETNMIARPHFLEYEDGDSEWTDLSLRLFAVCPPK